MKALTLLFIVSGLLLSIPNYCQNDNNDKLVKQNNQLRIKNESLKKKLIKLNTELKERIVQNEKLTQSLESNIKSLTDSITALNKRVNDVRSYSEVSIKSLQHRKKLFFIGLVLCLIAGVAGSYIVCKRYKKDKKSNDDKIKQLQTALEDKIVQIQAEGQRELKVTTTTLEQKINELGNLMRQ
jgi:hypothetical protein